MPTARALLDEGRSLLSETSATGALDAQILLEFAAGISRLKFISEPNLHFDEKIAENFRRMICRRASNEPVAYITGLKEFFGLPFEVSSAVLIPRPETELLVEQTLRLCEGKPGKPRVLDLGTGSGCIAIAIAAEVSRSGSEIQVVAVDKSAAALHVARKNAARNGVAKFVEFKEGDWFSSLERTAEKFQIIVSNPPYISEGDARVSPETRFEPHDALYSGSDGIGDLQRILTDAPAFLAPGGNLLLETGYEQHQALKEFINRAVPKRYNAVESIKDLSGHDRVLICTVP
jgi:release factor glutamine methyltransferase